MTSGRALQVERGTPQDGQIPAWSTADDLAVWVNGDGSGAVDSVNGQTGAVVLDAGDVGVAGAVRMLGPFTVDKDSLVDSPAIYTYSVDTPTPDGGSFSISGAGGNGYASTVSQGGGKRYWVALQDTPVQWGVYDTVAETADVAGTTAGTADPTSGGGVAHSEGDYYVQTDGMTFLPIALWVGGAGGDTDWTDLTSDTFLTDLAIPPLAWAVELSLQAYLEGVLSYAGTLTVRGGPLPDAPLTLTLSVANPDDVGNVNGWGLNDSSTGGTYARTIVQEAVLSVWGRELFTVQPGDQLLEAWRDLTETFDNDTDRAALGMFLSTGNLWRGIDGMGSLQDAEKDFTASADLRVDGLGLGQSGNDTAWETSRATVFAAEMLCLRQAEGAGTTVPTQGQADIYVMVATPSLT